MERKLIELYQELHGQGAFFFDRQFTSVSEDKKTALIQIGKDFAVFMDTEQVRTVAEETELVAHEGGHIATGTTHKVCSPLDLVEKHERKANKWAVHRILPPEDIRYLIRAGYAQPWEIAEQAGRTEGFVRLALDIYRAEGVDFSMDAAGDLLVAGL